MLQYPYSKLTKKQRIQLEQEMFQAINSIDCKLFSVTIDLDYHYKQYGSGAIW